MKTGDAGLPTTTALQSRVPLFQPTDRPAALADGAWQATKWGRVRVTGRLGQRHADLLGAILHTALRRRDLAGDVVELLVDPAAVRRTMGPTDYSGQQLKKLLAELRACTVEMEAPDLAGGAWSVGGLIDYAELSTGMVGTVRNPLGGTRHLLRVRLGKPMALLLKHDLSFFYNPAPIAALRHGVSKAIARHVKTHRDVPHGGWLLDPLIAAVGGPTTGASLRKARMLVLDDRCGLAACGVELSSDGRRVAVPSKSVPQAPGRVPQAPGRVP